MKVSQLERDLEAARAELQTAEDEWKWGGLGLQANQHIENRYSHVLKKDGQ